MLGGIRRIATWDLRTETMLTYEAVIETLGNAADGAQIRLYDAQSWMDTISLERTYRVFAVPASDQTPHRVRAEITFPWPVTYTVESVHGPTCCLYHGPDDPCPHQVMEPEVNLGLEVRYLLDVHDADAATDAGARVRQIVEAELAGDATAQIHFAISEEGDGPVSLTEVFAHTWWEFELGNTLDLSSAFDELRRVLTSLLASDLFPKDQAPERNPRRR